MANRSREADKQLSELLKELDVVFRAKVATFLSIRAVYDSTISSEDLYQAALCGAIGAYDKFDESLHVPLKAYLTINAYYAIMREFFSAVRIPRPLLKKMSAYAKSEELLESIFERPVTRAELADFMSVSDSELSDSMLAILSAAHIHLYDQDDFDVIDEAETVEQMVNRLETAKLVQSALADLPEREKLIVYHLFYLEEPLSKAGRAVGIRKQSVAERRDRIFAKLRQKLSGIPV